MIVLKKVRWKNVLSTGNEFTEIELDRHGTTLIAGSNGSGKSTCIDVLCFALYKKPFRNINIPNLVNTVNGKECLVEVEFDVGSRSYLIRRGIKPAVFEVYSNGELIPQSANVYDYQDNLEKNILRMNYKTFIQIVVLGSAAYTPFMLLPAANRREIIENLLDIDVFSRMNNLLKMDQKKNENLLSDLQNKEKIISSRISLMEKHIKELENNNEAQIDDLRKTKENFENELKGALENEESWIRDIEEHKKTRTSQSSNEIRSEISKIKEKERQLAKRKEKLLEAKTSMDHIEVCPRCAQSITDKVRKTLESQVYDQLVQVEEISQKIERKLQTLDARLKESQAWEQELAHKNEQLLYAKGVPVRIKEDIKTVESQIAKLQEARKEIDTSDLEKHIRARQAIQIKRDEALEQADLMNTAAALLKDGGIKTMIIKQYIPVMNKLINKFLEQMDFYCLFEIDETFKETMRAPYKDEMSYTSLSQGERMRVDIALLFTWREIARMRNAALTNILILDEIMDSSLDAAGTEEFLKIIQSIAKSSRIFVISHKAEQIIEKFERTIVFQKIANFSSIKNED